MDKITEYVYALMCYDPWLDLYFLDAVFRNPEDAAKYKAKRESEEDNEYAFTIDTVPIL